MHGYWISEGMSIWSTLSTVSYDSCKGSPAHIIVIASTHRKCNVEMNVLITLVSLWSNRD